MLKRIGRALTSPTAGVIVGVVLATFIHGASGLTMFGVGMVTDPPGAREMALLGGSLEPAPAIYNLSVGELLTAPLFWIWLALRSAAALAVCLPVALWSRWQFRHRSDPDSLLGTFLIMLPAALVWWLTMLAFQETGEMGEQADQLGFRFFGPLLALTPAALLALVASLFQRFGADRPEDPWRNAPQPDWTSKIGQRGRSSIPLAEVSLEPTIRAIEVDRTGLAVLGSLAAAIPGVLIIVLVMILAIVLSGLAGGGFPIAGFGKVIGFGLGVPVAILAGLALLRQRLPRGYTGLLVVLLLAGLGSSLVEPVWLMAIDATSPEAVQIKQRLLGTAAWTVPLVVLILLAWLRAMLRFGGLFRPIIGAEQRSALALVMADLAGLPRLVLGLGWRNLGAQLAAAFGLMLQAPLRVLGIAVISTGAMASLFSPLAFAKFQAGSASAACRGADFNPFAVLSRIETCPGNRDFDLAMVQLDQLPPLLSPLTLFLIFIPAFAGLWLGRAALAASARRYQKIASADPRPPVFYLRPFHLDRVSLKWRPRLWSTLIVPRPAEPRSIDEIILNGCIEDGPVVAYGRPGEPAPPLGAARLYVGTGDWKAMVLALAGASRYVVIAVEPTDGVVWEVEQTIANGWAEKSLYLLTSARDTGEAWRMVEGITGQVGTPQTGRGALRPVALIQREGAWQVLMARDISRLAVEAALRHFRAGSAPVA